MQLAIKLLLLLGVPIFVIFLAIAASVVTPFGLFVLLLIWLVVSISVYVFMRLYNRPMGWKDTNMYWCVIATLAYPLWVIFFTILLNFLIFNAFFGPILNGIFELFNGVWTLLNHGEPVFKSFLSTLLVLGFYFAAQTTLAITWFTLAKQARSQKSALK